MSEKFKKFYTIGELAKLYGLGVDSIRYYEEKGLLSPIRGTNGYRYYNLESIWRMSTISDLRGLGFSVEQIGKYFENHNTAAADSLLTRELGVIDEKIAALEKLRATVLRQRNTLRSAKKCKPGIVSIIDIEPRKAIEIQQNYSADEEMDVLMERLISTNGNDLYIIGNNQIASVMADEGSEFVYRAAWLFDENGDVDIPGGRYLSVYYSGKAVAPQQAQLLKDYAEANGIRVAKPFIDIIWIDIHSSSDPAEHIYEMQVRIED